MVRFRRLILAVVLMPAAVATADAQWPENDPYYDDYSAGSRTIRGRRGSGASANQLNVVSILASSAFSLALSGNGNDGQRAGRNWGWMAVGVGFASFLSAGTSFRASGSEPLLSVASIVAGGFSLMAGARNLYGASYQASHKPDQGAFFPPRERLSIAPIVAPTAKAAGVSVSLRF